MKKASKFSLTERRVIASMFKLNRWATANEIAKWADGMSWNTADKILKKILLKKKIVQKKKVDGKFYWMIKNF